MSHRAPNSTAMLAHGLRRAGATLVLLALILWNAWIAHAMVTRLQMGDFRILYLSARAQLEGRAMYDLPSELQTHLGRPLRLTLVNLNPPHFQLLFLPLALLSASVSLTLWAVASFACLGVSLFVVGRELHLTPTLPGCWRGAVWLLAFAGMGAVLATGEVSFLLMLPLTLAWAAARQGNWNRAGVYLGIAMSLKLFLLIFVPYLLLRRRLGVAMISCATSSGCFVAGALILGLGTYRSWLDGLVSVTWAWRSANASVLGILSRSLSENPYYTPVLAAPDLIAPLWLSSVAVIAVLSLVATTWDRTAAAVDRAFAILLTAALLISPLGWIYYLWLALGPVAALAMVWRNATTSARPGPSGWAARWPRRSLVLAVPALVWPHFATFAFQPDAGATLTFASAYFWGVAALWCAIVLDWWAATLRAARPADASTGASRMPALSS